jgi:hypothetical protein
LTIILLDRSWSAICWRPIASHFVETEMTETDLIELSRLFTQWMAKLPADSPMRGAAEEIDKLIAHDAAAGLPLSKGRGGWSWYGQHHVIAELLALKDAPDDVLLDQVEAIGLTVARSVLYDEAKRLRYTDRQATVDCIALMDRINTLAAPSSSA